MDLFFLQKWVQNAQKLDCFTVLLATKWVSVFGPFRPIFGQKIDPKLPRSHFFLKRIHQTKFQLKIPIFSKSDDDATWWPNSYKKILTCGQLRNIQRWQKYVRHVRAFFLELRTCSSQQCLAISHSMILKIQPHNLKKINITNAIQLEESSSMKVRKLRTCNFLQRKRK